MFWKVLEDLKILSFKVRPIEYYIQNIGKYYNIIIKLLYTYFKSNAFFEIINFLDNFNCDVTR